MAGGGGAAVGGGRGRRAGAEEADGGRAPVVVPASARAALARRRRLLRRVLGVRHVRGVPRADPARPRLRHRVRHARRQLGLPRTAALLAHRRVRRILPRQTVYSLINPHARNHRRFYANPTRSVCILAIIVFG